MITIDELLKVTEGKLLGKKENISIGNFSIDSRTINYSESFIALKGPRFDGHNFIKDAIAKGANLIIASNTQIIQGIIEESGSKNIEFSIVQVKDTKESLIDLAHYNRKKYPAALVAITGTNGKTTTKEMAASVLSAEYEVFRNKGNQNNEIGLSLNLLSLRAEHKIAVMELGTSHPGEIKQLADITRANIGIITNIGPGHLEFFHTVENVFEEKKSLLENLDGPAISIINRDDTYLSKISADKMFSFGIKNKADIMASDIIVKGGIISFMLNKKHKFLLNSIAWHNVYNALSAISCGIVFGVSIKKMQDALERFCFPPSRMNILHLNDITILDDTYNSNPSSLKAAIETLSRYSSSRRILVMADMLELGESSLEMHRDIGRFVAESNIDYFITVGKFSEYAAKEADKFCKSSKKIINCSSSQEAASILLGTMAKGDVVLVKGSHATQMEKVIENIKTKDAK